MERVRAAVDRTLEAILVLLMALMVGNVVWQVATRFILRAPSSYTEELARYLLIWLSLLGAAYAAGQGLHLAIDLATRRLEGRARAGSDAFIQLCVFLFAALVMVAGGIYLVYISFSLRQISAALRISVGYVYLVLPLSGLLVMFYAAADFARRRRAAPGAVAAGRGVAAPLDAQP